MYIFKKAFLFCILTVISLFGPIKARVVLLDFFLVYLRAIEHLFYPYAKLLGWVLLYLLKNSANIFFSLIYNQMRCISNLFMSFLIKYNQFPQFFLFYLFFISFCHFFSPLSFRIKNNLYNLTIPNEKFRQDVFYPLHSLV